MQGRDQDSAVFEALYREHYPHLCAFVNGYVRSAEIANDLVQDLFLALWEKQAGSGARELTVRYLYAAARNRALKHLRHRRVVHRFQLRASIPRVQHGNTDHEVREREVAEAVDAAIAALPPRCREIFVLSRRQQMSYVQIAAALGVSVKTVEVQMWRALRKLRSRLAPYLTTATIALISVPLTPLG